MRKVVLLYKDTPIIYGEEVFRTNPMEHRDALVMEERLRLLGCRDFKKVAA